MTAGRATISLSQGRVPLLVGQCSVVRFERVYRLTTKWTQHGDMCMCVCPMHVLLIHVHKYICAHTCMCVQQVDP